MSFALTTAQVRRREKTVTRRLGWKNAKPGDIVQPVVKGQGIPKGGTVEKIGGPIRFVNVRREPLMFIGGEPDGCKREGFPDMHPAAFVEMFAQHNGCKSMFDEVTRIEFEYLEPQP